MARAVTGAAAVATRLRPSLAGVLLVTTVIFAGLWLLERGRAAVTRDAQREAAAALAPLRERARLLDSSLAASATADSVRRAGQDSSVASHHQQAVRSGETVTLLDSTAIAQVEQLACEDTAGVNALLRTLAVRDAAMAQHQADDATAHADQEHRHDDDVATIVRLQTSALPQLQRQRDDAMGAATTNLARAIAAERRWPAWRRILTAGSCAAAGVGAVKGDAALGLGGGAVCVGSLSLR